ncbi:MAG: GIY-YIG nuclease family protein, partial [Flavobacteriales bacterium]|nr:GIY-YIG nuclease family protein [Flavobacteriales bacterium]
MKEYYVYIMSSDNKNSIYIGVTNDLERRIYEHQNKLVKGFTQKYNCVNLVYFETHNQIVDAIYREKQLKNWNRQWKIGLIEKDNKQWDDLSVDWKLYSRSTSRSPKA